MNFNDTMDKLIDKNNEETALDYLKQYFSDRDGKGTHLYIGRWFNELGNNEPNKITIDDLCAVQLLGIRLKNNVFSDILHDEKFQGFATEKLSNIADVDIWKATDFYEVNLLWKKLITIHNIGDVIAGKILSRKRPRLIPIYDGLVSDLLKAPTGQYWDSFRLALQYTSRRERLLTLRKSAGLEDISLLRTFDVIAWMEKKQGRILN